MGLIGTSREWQGQAACRLAPDPRWDEPEMTTWCADYCMSCPVRLECFTEALDRHHTEDVGVWGGTTARQRDAIRRRKLTLREAWAATERMRTMTEDLATWTARAVLSQQERHDPDLNEAVARMVERLRDGRSRASEGREG